MHKPLILVFGFGSILIIFILMIGLLSSNTSNISASPYSSPNKNLISNVDYCLIPGPNCITSGPSYCVAPNPHVKHREQITDSGNVVYLDGSSSSGGLCGGIDSWKWGQKQTDPVKVKIYESGTSKAFFIAPEVEEETEFNFVFTIMAGGKPAVSTAMVTVFPSLDSSSVVESFSTTEENEDMYENEYDVMDGYLLSDNPDEGVKIQYPSSWFVHPLGTQITYTPDDLFEDEMVEFVIDHITLKHPGQTLEDFINQEKIWLIKYEPKADYVGDFKKLTFKIDGNDAYIAHYGNEYVDGFRIYTVSGQHGYTIDYSAHKELYDYYLSYITQMINSIEFYPQNN